jgi:mannose-1-phosphate guanylyltransferase
VGVKAFLLAAGHGTRLRPLTNNTPKCLLPVCGTPILDIWLQACHRFGIEDVLVNIHSHAELVRNYLSAHNFGVRVRLVEEKQLLGSGGTLSANRDWVRSDPFFWVFYTDVLSRVGLADMARCHRERQPAATLGVYRVPDPTRCGIVDVDDHGMIRHFVEKPRKPTGNLAFSGLLIGTPALLEAIPQAYPSDIGFDVLPKLVGNMLAYRISEYLLDIGTIQNYRQAQITWPGVEE